MGLTKTHEMYTVLMNPPMQHMTPDGVKVRMSRQKWTPVYKRQSISAYAQRTAEIYEFDELHHELRWYTTTTPLVVLKNDIKHWLDDNSQQWEDGKETHKLIKPKLPELITDPAKINNWLGVIEKITGWF